MSVIEILPRSTANDKKICSLLKGSCMGLNFHTCPQKPLLPCLYIKVAPWFWPSYVHQKRQRHAGRAKAPNYARTKPRAAPWGWTTFISDPLANSPPEEKDNIQDNWGPTEVTRLWSKPLIPAITAYLQLPYVQRGALETPCPSVAKPRSLTWIELWYGSLAQKDLGSLLRSNNRTFTSVTSKLSQ